MNTLSRLLTTAALLPLGLPAAAVTPEEVWAMFTDVTAATGGTLDATESRDGDTLTVNDVAVSYVFPFGVGEFSMRLGPYTLTDLGDGTVSMSTPDNATIAFAGRLVIEEDEAAFTGSVSVAQPGSEIIASGTADDITMTSSVPSMEMALEQIDVTIPGEEVDLSSIVGTFTGSDNTGTTRYQREANVYRITGEGTSGPSSYAVTIPGEFGGTSENTGGSASATATSTLVLPRAPMSLMNLSAAIRDGLLIDVTSTATGVTSGAITMLSETEILSEQSQTTATQTTAFSFGPDGLNVSGSAQDTDITFSLPDLFPLPIAASLGNVDFRMILPTLASPDSAVPVEYDIALEGLDIDGQLWSLFDPAEFLPRDPLDVVIDLGADIRPGIDALDVEAIIAAVNLQEVPVELDNVRLDELRVSGAGAEIKGNGAFSLDFNDMSTFPDFPRPEGDAIVTISGANTLIDKLVEMGLIGDEEVMGARMGLGMFTTPTGDDTVESFVEVNAEGHVLVNGQRMR